MKSEQAESTFYDEVQAEISRLENTRACLEAKAVQLEMAAKNYRHHAAIASDKKKWLEGFFYEKQ